MPRLLAIGKGLALKGTKRGCDRGPRSNCTAQLAGAAERSSAMPTDTAGGHKLRILQGRVSLRRATCGTAMVLPEVDLNPDYAGFLNNAPYLEPLAGVDIPLDRGANM